MSAVVEEKIQKGLKKFDVKVEFEAGLDSTDDNALWVWVKLGSDVDGAIREKIRDEVRKVVTALAEERELPFRWVYVRFPGE